MADLRRLILAAQDGDLTRFRDLYAKEFGKNRADNEAAREMNDYARMDPDDIGKSSNKSSGGYQNRSTDDYNSPTNIGGWVQKGMATQFKNNAGMDPHEFQDMNSILGIFLNDNGSVKNPMGMLKGVLADIGEGIVLNFHQQNQLLMKINEGTGMLGTLSRTFREEITEAYPAAVRLGISFEVLTDAVANLVASSGKFKLLSKETIEEMALASIFAKNIGEYAALAPKFEEVSLGIYDMTRLTNKAGKDALATGLNSRAVVAGIGEKLGLLNQYGFKNGVEGLSQMVQKSIEFRMNMESVTGLAEKVWSPEGALDLVANLQVIGGAFGDLNDPLKLMYMATNNMEGLQDAIIGASKSLVTYNNEQGRFEVTGANLRRAKAMADELGMSMGELTKTAVASMERTQAASEIMSRGLKFVDEKDREFLTNLSQMKEGRMVIEVPKSLQESMGEQTEIALEGMTQKQADILLSQRDAFKEMSMKEIAMDQVSLMENINRDVSFITALMRIQSSKLANDVAGALGYDPLKLAIEAANMTDTLGKKIDVNLVYDAINKNFGTNLKHQVVGGVVDTRQNSTPVDLKSKPTETTNTTTTPTQHIRVEHNFRSDQPTYDEASRIANKIVQNGVKLPENSFLTPFTYK